MRDLANNLSPALALSSAVQAATIKGNAVDMSGFNSVMFVIATGAIASAGDFTPKLQESDTTTDGDFTDVVAADLVGSLPASLTADAVFKQGYIGSKKYVRVVLTKNGGTSIAAGAIAVRGNARLRPLVA